MKMFPLFVILCALGASSASARVGETFEQIERRYGPQVHGSKTEDGLGNYTLTYHFHGFTVEVTFVNMRSEREFFVKYTDYIPAERWEKMTPQEVDAILAAYEGVKWKSDDKSGRRPMWWNSEDGRLKAINMANQLVIVTVDYEGKMTADRERREAHKRANEEQRLKGF